MRRAAAPTAPAPEPRSAPESDIRGALGTLRGDGERPRGFRRRLLALMAIAGPGIIVMVGDNDAGGVATYSQAGQDFGLSLLWVLLLLIPVLIVNQEMVVRLGAVTGMGHGKLIFERFGRFWGAFSVGDLFILNFLTLVTEFIGVGLALGYFGVSPYISVPVMALALIAVTVTGSFERWERFMFLFIAANFLVVPLLLMSHPHLGPVVHGFLVPGIQGGLTGSSVLLVIAIVGTTVAPWQLFFQQSNIVDKRITPRWISYERFDTVLGSLVTVLAAAALIVICALAFRSAPYAGAFKDAGAVARGLGLRLGPWAGALYSIVLLNASLIGAATLSIATSYAVGDTFGIRHSLHRSLSEARGFYGSFALLILAAAGTVLVPRAPLGLITTAVQALAGVLLPSATVFLLLLCNDVAVLGPWVNPRWLNAVAVAIISTLLALSAILTVSTVFPTVDVPRLVAVVGGALVIGLLALGGLYGLRPPSRRPQLPRAGREMWTMPALALLERPPQSLARRLALGAMWIYLVGAGVMLAVKVVQLAGGGG
ncbi:MAG TPA: NRAMP family divalent metal transporter [Candidatus Nitrosotalea sp.]|nr:NRAMP family divalent metal transporter [Candidatus Nitrosotalea sp.]